MLDKPTLINGRWQVGEFLFVEYQQGRCVIVDVGPFPNDPEVEELDKAYAYLQNAHLPYFHFGELNWLLDVPKFGEWIPEILSEKLEEHLSHPPAFETARMPGTPEFLVHGAAAPIKAYVLRVTFEFHPQEDPFGDSVPPADATEVPDPSRDNSQSDFPKLIS